MTFGFAEKKRGFGVSLMNRSDFCAYLLDIFEKNELSSYVNEERAELFFRLTEHMLTVNESFNLTAIKEPRRIALLHYADSVKGACYIPKGARVIDVGCGAGFPSLPLAICRPDLSILALDSTAKRVGYVAETAALLGLSNISTIVARAEDAAKDVHLRESFDCATARAVASLPVLCELCLPFVKCGGVFAAMKGKSAQEELIASKRAVSLLGGESAVLYDTPLYSEEGEEFSHATVVVQKARSTPKEYPRIYAKIAKAPL